MKTEWGERLDRKMPLPEYPRPQMARDSFLSLNGVWEYAITHTAEKPDAFDGPITVPFSPECELSGVKRILQPAQTLWYRRLFRLPDGFNHGRVLLHFGAVDQLATVYVNGKEVAFHVGGYLPFTADITRALRNENLLVVKVQDYTDTSYHSRGKQKLAPGGIWYTPQSGIWQTVWLESVPRHYIESLCITPKFDESAVEITAFANTERACVLRLGERELRFHPNATFTVPMEGFTPWTPETPHLYPFSIEMEDDRVESYFAMRKCAVAPDAEGIPRLTLNNKPYFQTGVLDQGYWPEGLYTAPSDEAMISDIEQMKALGFNMLRKHIKIEPLRFYYHCDRLGMLVWQDMVNGGDVYRPRIVTLPLVTGIHLSDGKRSYRRMAREDVAGREEYQKELFDTVKHLYNCPCIVMWVPFNEGWGQFDAADTAARIKAIDPTRPVDHASGWHDQGAGDVMSRHVYFKPYRFHKDPGGRAVVLSEFGGYNRQVPGHSLEGKPAVYRIYDSKEALTRAFVKLYEKEVLPAKPKGLSAAVYTQLSDVEHEQNGLLTYDRAVVKPDAEAVRRVNAALRD